jgi:hypothetical protein
MPHHNLPLSGKPNCKQGYKNSASWLKRQLMAGGTLSDEHTFSVMKMLTGDCNCNQAGQLQ